MTTRKAEEYAERELKRRLSPRHGLSIWWVILWVPVLWLASVLLLVSLWRFPKDFVTGWPAISFAVAFLAGSVLFCIFPCRPLYVFGHELTHWLAAVLTARQTGALRLGLRKGSVEIPRPTLFIALAPYFIPLFLLISAGLFAFAGLCWPSTPPLFWCAAFAWLGLCYSYHIVLTILALAHGQSDLQYRGPMLSYAVILFGNLLVLYLAMVMLSQNWRAGWEIPWQIFLELKRSIP
ncbi:MAG: hypothetical protein II943_10560 [Victivallales bacterium]|nr:hypothetical protein [Victivallales bacterium]